jgi:hypothetical protein
MRRIRVWLVSGFLCTAPCAVPSAAWAQLDLEAEAEVDLEAGAEAEASADAEDAPSEPAEDEPLDNGAVIDDTGEDEPPEEPELAAPPPDGEPEAQAPPPERAIALYAAVGLGVGTLTFTKPTAAGVQHLTESAFAAAEALLRVQIWPTKSFSLEAQIAYQTSLGFALELRPLFALPERVSVRAQRVELSFGPRIAFSSSKRGVAVALPVGFALRSFFPEVHYYSVETHKLGSLFVRPELIVPLGDLISLRGGPELHWLMLTEAKLEREGATGSGYALGYQGAVQASVGSTFSVALAYHELRSVLPAAARFEDTERFLTARFGGGL